jgi:sugar lactone lactonase YvrE
MKKAYLLLLPAALLITTLVKAQAGFITTVAGDGIAGFAGDGQPATNAKIDTIGYTAVDDSGNIYISDAQNNRIRKIYARTGEMATIAGNGFPGWTGDYGAATLAEVYYPFGIAVDHNFNVYFCDNGNGVIRKINQSTGIITTIAGTGNGGNTGNGGKADTATFDDCVDIAVDGAGNLYISDDVAGCVRIILASNNMIYQYAGNNTAGYSGDGSAATAAQLNKPLGIAVDNSGNLYIADWMNYVIRKVNTSGTISTVAGIAGNNAYNNASGNATAVPLSSPTGVACDKNGFVYVADAGDNVVRRINVNTNYDLVVAGDTGAGFSGDNVLATTTELNYPFTVSLDTNSNIYIGDLLNFRIREVGAVPTAVPQISNSGRFAIYPNPVNNTLNIQFSASYTSGKNTFEIVDITGRTITSFDRTVNSGNIIPVDVSALSGGMYFIKVSNNTSSQVLKFIKE